MIKSKSYQSNNSKNIINKYNLLCYYKNKPMNNSKYDYIIQENFFEKISIQSIYILIFIDIIIISLIKSLFC